MFVDLYAHSRRGLHICKQKRVCKVINLSILILNCQFTAYAQFRCVKLYFIRTSYIKILTFLAFQLHRSRSYIDFYSQMDDMQPQGRSRDQFQRGVKQSQEKAKSLFFFCLNISSSLKNDLFWELLPPLCPLWLRQWSTYCIRNLEGVNYKSESLG